MGPIVWAESMTNETQEAGPRNISQPTRKTPDGKTSCLICGMFVRKNLSASLLGAKDLLIKSVLVY